jgi:hypothetical protein
VVGAVAFGLKVVEEALGEVFFVFDEDDKGCGGFSHGCFLQIECVTLRVT